MDELSSKKLNGIQITEKMANDFLNSLKLRNLNYLNVAFSKDILILKGKAKLKLLSTSFEVNLKLVEYEDRRLRFELIKMNPVNMKLLNDQLFNNYPITSYRHSHVYVNLNEIKMNEDFPIGRINDIKLGEEILSIFIDE